MKLMLPISRCKILALKLLTLILRLFGKMREYVTLTVANKFLRVTHLSTILAEYRLTGKFSWKNMKDSCTFKNVQPNHL